MTGSQGVEVPIEVRYAETDQMGVVHHAVYPVWFEVARTRLCATSGVAYPEIERRGYYLLVTGLQVEYRRSARYGEDVAVRCWLDRFASRGLHFAYEVHGNGRLLVRGRTEHVWVEAASGKPCRIPDWVEQPFRDLAAAAESNASAP